MRSCVNPKKRILRFFAAVCVFAFLAPASSLVICPDCGHEAKEGAANCSCGYAYGGDPAGVSPSNGQAPGPFSPLSEISKDMAQARNAAKSDPEFARLLYRNAQALMASWQERGEDFDKASAIIMRELAALPKGRRPDKALRAKAEDFQRGLGRTPLGEVWIPGNWLKDLPQSSLAAVRRSIPPSCSNCGGLGKTDCAKCAGTGFTPCKNPKCTDGHIHVLPDNVLNPATALKVRKKCPACKGRESLACRACRGEKALPCKKCKGDGYAPLCRNCHGTGLKACAKCASGSNSACHACKGHGEVLCAKCGGAGRIPD